jgi:hypothetical protein
MTDVQHTVLDTNNGWGGTALGAGFGGLIGSWFGQGMNGNGWGGGNNNTYLANQLSAIQSQAVTNGVANQQAVSNASQYVTEAVNSNGRDTTQAINNGTIANVQGQGDTKLTIAGLGANLSQAIMGLGANLAQAIAGVNENITKQGYEARLSQQQLALQLTEQHNELLKAVDREGCANRELQRQIQTEAIAGALADAKSQVNILKQTQDIVAQLKPAATAG